MKKILLIICLIPFYSFAGVDCTEKISTVILHQNGNVYFQTDKTCGSWCQIKWTSEKDKDRAFSMLLTAKTANQAVRLYWNDLSSCSEKNVTYQSPEYIIY
ncbi:hypothetical protein [Vibrio parahaemolyticus]|uniref:hypothetical protein n=1 Tax=Vibrio parahaemolyticus TaxID=670 RepID=UPI00215C3169|nr:hypothetical protein [Vibrio parahaemolyticus]MCR9664450.1 hypothetical protein [Vibrio parahaemolyticus]MCR9679316.1 hypothetical protein [Vibrio parahaemolyticus]MDF5193158.1 hypothetical protein [Vibrio parahaemolyticus]MDG2702881.1 hypothetical protein [Vibrio parahaemolyticus]